MHYTLVACSILEWWLGHRLHASGPHKWIDVCKPVKGRHPLPRWQLCIPNLLYIDLQKGKTPHADDMFEVRVRHPPSPLDALLKWNGKTFATHIPGKTRGQVGQSDRTPAASTSFHLLVSTSRVYNELCSFFPWPPNCIRVFGPIFVRVCPSTPGGPSGSSFRHLHTSLSAEIPTAPTLLVAHWAWA